MHGSARAKIPNFFTIPPSVAFLPKLAAWLLENIKEIERSEALVFLPTRRACRALQQAMLDSMPKDTPSALILPRIIALADIENEPVIQHLLLSHEAMASRYMALPPTMSNAERRVRMQRLVHAFYPQLLPAQAMALADDLLTLLDECQTHQVSPQEIRQILPEHMAEHWQVMIPALQLITEEWPKLMHSLHQSDPITRRHEIISLLEELFATQGYHAPVVAAGSTGSQPATARLLCRIAELEKGTVLLSGLDMVLSDEAWQHVDAGHPQWALKQLLAQARMPRSAVKQLSSKALSHEDHFYSAAFLPEQEITGWRKAVMPWPENLRVLAHDSQAQEAQTLTLLIREVLEQSEKTVALLTPSIELMQRVQSNLSRYGIVLESSAGQTLRDTPSGVFLRLVIEWMLQPTQPLAILAMLQHPLAHAGMSREESLAAARRFEIEQCRGVIFHKEWESFLAQSSDAGSQKMLRYLQHIALQLPKDNEHLSAEYLFKKALQIMEELSINQQQQCLLWISQEAESWQAWCAEWLNACVHMSPLYLHEFPSLVESMLAGSVVRRPYAHHPRIALLSPMEGRLLHFDRVILAGMNEGVWPETPASGPWMSAAMRAQAGLPSPLEKLSQQALDIYIHAHSKEVFMSYSHKIGQSPVLPSRWLERLWACLQATQNMTRESIHQRLSHPAQHWAEGWQMAPEAIKISAPAPDLAHAQWPQKSLSATTIERLIRNPYAVYVSKILRIIPLDPLDAMPDPKESGTHLHAVLEQWKREEAILPSATEEAFEALWKRAAATLDALQLLESTRIFWEKEWRNMLAHFLQWDMESAAHQTLVLEQRGAINLGDFEIHATPDRMDVMDEDGGLRVIDYKSKKDTAISDKDIEEGQFLQLPIAALIAREGGFSAYGIAKNISTHSLEYWTLKSTERKYVASKNYPNMDAYVSSVEEGLRALLDYYSKPQAQFPYDPAEKIKKPYDNDMPHLARVKEWR